MQDLFNNILADPYGYAGVLMGLTMATSIVTASSILLVSFAVKVVRTNRARITYKHAAVLLREIMLRNAKTDPKLAALAAVMMKTLDPYSEIFEGDLEAARIALNLPSAEEVAEEALAQTSN